MTTRLPRARPIRRWIFFGLAVVVGVVCVRLGIWQLDRLAQRRAFNAAVRAQLALPTVSLPADLAQTGDLAYRHATALGTFDPSHEIYLTSRSLDGIAGVEVVTPLLLQPAGPAMLVDRGWISEEVYRGGSSSGWSVDGPVEVAGTLMPPQHEPSLAFLADRVPAEGEAPLTEWRALSIPGIRRQIPYPVLDVYMMQEGEAPNTNAPRPNPELDLSEGPHLGYAVQWFAFAATALIGGFYWLRRSSRSVP